MFTVVEDNLSFSKKKGTFDARTGLAGDQLTLVLPVTGGVEGRQYRVHSQVFATDSNGALKPACWIGGMSLMKNEQLTGNFFFFFF